MTESTRGLAAVMFADMVDFTALVGQDEQGARRQRDRQRKVVSESVERFGGRVRQYYGDGTLSVFGSAVSAVRCAIAIQSELQRPPSVKLRIGIHTGDVVDEIDSVYGDGVNVASRIESLCVAGGVMISDKVFDEIKNHPDLEAVSLGTARLKNVKRPMEVFALSGNGLVVPTARDLANALPSKRRQLVPLVIGAGIVVAAAAWALLGDTASAPTEAATPSIAVLPFRDLSAESENAAFFADGIHDDILTQLTKIGSLAVIARTSVMRYADTEKPIVDIGRELGVSTIVEGGVQRAGNRIRLNVQLIDARTDTHIWADTYDRELTAENVFSIQSEVAEAISAELHALLSGDERRRLTDVPTLSLEAYDHYLRGSRALRRSNGLGDLTAAEQELSEAVRIDPDFGAAWARLTYVHLNIYWQAFDRSDGRLELATEALERAEAIDPDGPEVLFARGYYHYWGFRDYPAARAAFSAARALLPGDSRLHEALAFVLRRVGEWDEAVAELSRATALDPMNTEVVWELGETYFHVRDYDRAQQTFDQVLAIDPGVWAARYERALSGVYRDGTLDPMRPLVLEPNTEYPNVQTFARWWLAYVDGDERTAFEVSGGLTGPLQQQADLHPATLLNALMYRSRGRSAAARVAADSARAELSALAELRPEDPRVYAALGTALAILGRRDEAVAAGEEAVRLLPVERDAMDGPKYLVDLARVHALVGEDDRAAALLAQVLSAPARTSRASLLLEPDFSRLGEHPALR